MAKMWLMARHEYLKNVRRRGFVLGTLGIPLFIILIMGVSILVAVGGENKLPLGYVDQSGVLAAQVPATGPNDIELRSFRDQAAARAALEAGDIQGYYVIPSDYLETKKVSLYYWNERPNSTARNQFDAFLRANLVAGLPAEVRQRVLDGSELTLRSADGQRQIRSDEGINLLLPGVAGMFFLFAVMTSAGYLLQAVADEKENRTIELMATSLTPGQLIGGKAVGLIGVALTQMLIWVATAVVALSVGAQYLDALKALRLPWEFLLIMALFFFPSYALVAGIMIAIGGIVTETRQGQQIAGIVNLLFTAPFFFVAIALTNPDSPLLVALTVFPTSAFMTIALRWSLTVIPAWQMIGSWVILVATAGFSVWAAARIFRAGMLRYGQRLDLRGMIQAVRAGAQT